MLAVAVEHKRMGKRNKPKPAKALSPLARDPASGVTVATMGDDRGPPERWQHQAYLDDKSDRGAPTRRRMLDPSPLEHYRRRRLITDRQYVAGDRLSQAWLLAGLEPKVVADYTKEVFGGQMHSNSSADALTRCVLALRDAGPELAPVLIHVVYMEGTATGWAEQKGHRGKYAEIVGLNTLRLGLDALARHYRLPESGQGELT